MKLFCWQFYKTNKEARCEKVKQKEKINGKINETK
jgi:hypothetical protein